MRTAIGVCLGLAAFGAFVMLVDDVDATHFRGGTLYAEPTGVPNQVKFGGVIAFRGTAFGSPALGTEFIVQPLDTGDGIGTSFALRAIQVNTVQDWVVGEIVTPGSTTPGVLYTYSSATNAGTPWLASWQSCCRLSNGSPNHHVNNPDFNWRLETTVNAGNEPPKPDFTPVEICQTWSLCFIDVPYTDGTPGDAVSVRFGTGGEATGGSFNQPGGIFPGENCPTPLSLATLGPNTVCLLQGLAGAPHQLVWNTFGATLYTPEPAQRTYYSTQVMLEDHVGIVTAPVKTKVPVDFLIRLTSITPPVYTNYSPCNANPAFVGHPNLKVYDGATLTFKVKSEAYQTNTTTIDPTRTLELYNLVTPLPAGMTLGAASGTNPIERTITYTPPVGTLAGSTIMVEFFTQDLAGISSLQNCKVYIDILAVPTLTAAVAYSDLPYGLSCDEPHSDFAGFTLDGVVFTSSLSYLASGPLVQEYLWNFGDPGSPVPFGNGLVESHAYDDPGTYPVTFDGRHRFLDAYESTTWTYLPDADGFDATVTIKNRCPDAQFGVTVSGGQYASTTDSSTDTDGTIVSRVWNFGDGSDPVAGATPMHMYTTEGNFQVCLTVTDNHGATDTNCRLVRIKFRLMSAPDLDLDGVDDYQDNCLSTSNGGQLDSDGDGIGNDCDDAPYTAGSTALTDPQAEADAAAAAAAAALAAAAIDDRIDTDRDGVEDVADNCPAVANAAQGDLDADGEGDVCDSDADGDRVAQGTRLGVQDNCPLVANPDQADADRDGLGDACDLDAPLRALSAEAAAQGFAAAGAAEGAAGASCSECADGTAVPGPATTKTSFLQSSGGVAVALLVCGVLGAGVVLLVFRRWK